MVLRHKRDVEAVAEELKVNRRLSREANRPTGTEINLTTETVLGMSTDVEDAKEQAAQAIEDAANALTASNGKNARRRGQTEPEPPAGGWVAGDQWVVDNGDGVPVEVRVWDGTAFVHEQVLASELLILSGGGVVRLAEGTVTADALVADAIDGMIITGALFRTAAAGRRLQFDTLGLRSFDEAGNEVGRFETRDDGFHFFGDIFTWPTGDMNDPAARFTADLIEFMGGGSPYQQNARLTRQGLSSTARATGSHLLVQHDSGDVSDAEVRIVAKWTKLFPPNAGVQATTLAVHPGGVFLDGQPIRHAEAAGEALFTGAINNGSGTTLTVTFPSGRFTEPPIVTASALSSSRLNVAVLRTSVTKDECQIRLDNFSGANMGAGANNGVTWHAVQMTKGSGAG